MNNFTKNFKTMKKLSLILAMFLPLLGLAQPDVISSGGNYYETSNVKVSYTIGQTVTATVGSNQAVMTQGFQQPSYSIVDLKEPDADMNVSLYPNPTDGELMLDFSTLPANNTQVMVIDFAGKLVMTETVTNQKQRLNLKNLPAGNYIVKIKNDTQERNFKVIKK
jgi:hypothetical protein